METGVKRQGSKPPGEGQCGAKRPRTGAAKAPTKKKPAAAVQEERPDEALRKIEAEAQRLQLSITTRLRGADIAVVQPRQAANQREYLQHYGKDPGHRVPLQTFMEEAEPEADDENVATRADSAPPQAARRASTRGQARALQEAQAGLKNLFQDKAVAAPAAAQRPQSRQRGARPAGSKPAKAAIPQGAFNASWWDGNWTVVTEVGEADIIVKNMEFRYGRDHWKIQRDGKSILMRWPHRPEVVSQLKHAERTEVIWEAFDSFGPVATVVWQKDAPKTRASTAIVVGGKGPRDVPLQGPKNRMPSKRSLEAPPSLVAAHPAGAPGAEAVGRSQKSRCTAPSEDAGRTWPAGAAGTY